MLVLHPAREDRQIVAGKTDFDALDIVRNRPPLSGARYLIHNRVKVEARICTLGLTFVRAGVFTVSVHEEMPSVV